VCRHHVRSLTVDADESRYNVFHVMEDTPRELINSTPCVSILSVVLYVLPVLVEFHYLTRTGIYTPNSPHPNPKPVAYFACELVTLQECSLASALQHLVYPACTSVHSVGSTALSGMHSSSWPILETYQVQRPPSTSTSTST